MIHLCYAIRMGMQNSDIFIFMYLKRFGKENDFKHNAKAICIRLWHERFT